MKPKIGEIWINKLKDYCKITKITNTHIYSDIYTTKADLKYNKPIMLDLPIDNGNSGFFIKPYKIKETNWKQRVTK